MGGEFRHRYMEKLVLFKSLAQGNVEEAERIVRRLYEREANGTRGWRWSPA